MIWQLWQLFNSNGSCLKVLTVSDCCLKDMAVLKFFFWVMAVETIVWKLWQLWQFWQLCDHCESCVSGELPVVGSLLPAPSPAPPVCLVQYSLQWELSTVSKTLFIHHTINNKPLSLFISARCSIPFNESLAQWVKHCKAILPSPIYHHHITLLHGAVFPSTRTQHSE